MVSPILIRTFNTLQKVSPSDLAAISILDKNLVVSIFSLKRVWKIGYLKHRTLFYW